MTKITKLTSDQELQLPAFRDEIRAKCLRLQWADDTDIRASVHKLYTGAGLEQPIVFVLESPLQCLMARMIIKVILGDKGQLRDQLGDQLWGQLRGQLWDQLRDQLRGQLGDQLGGQLGGQLWGQLWDQLRDQLRGQLGDQLGGQLRDHLWDQLGGQLGGQLWDQLWGQLRDQLGDQLRGQQIENQTLWFSGGSEGYWVALYRFAQQVGVKYTQEQADWLDAWLGYAETCGPLYPYEGIAFVSRRPTALHFDDERRLHCEIGPAMAFGDGFAMHAWHGTRIPSEWIDAPDVLTPKVALATENIEQRRAACEILGWAKIIRELGARVIDDSGSGDVGALVEVDLPGDEDEPSVTARYLHVQCGTGREFAIGVPPHISTAMSAQAWLQGIPEDAFSIPSIRT